MSNPPRPHDVATNGSLKDHDTSVSAGPKSSPAQFTGGVCAVLVAQLALTIAVLEALGRDWWCKLGDLSIIILSAANAHTSQHLIDPYTFTHVAHGFIFCGILALIAPAISLANRGLLSIAVECVWEIFENTPFVIERYRTATAALGYEGDSIANSLSDIVACAIGFIFAARFGWWITVLVFAAFELLLLITIRDSLVLNILMLCYPVDVIRDWQLRIAE